MGGARLGGARRGRRRPTQESNGVEEEEEKQEGRRDRKGSPRAWFAPKVDAAKKPAHRREGQRAAVVGALPGPSALTRPGTPPASLSLCRKR